uniref:Sugar phosphate phosphatase n=1 Tax=Lotharella oceanica TaxID=641309 RepID=A0A7S2THK4_9EUKA|mmetsp:Transcript_12900/g.24635  ORF Transcript_12900/g.24635 Transcript_12900/m.24635 type:complete len:449 (+) Transcript_12900:26-1372(+)
MAGEMKAAIRKTTSKISVTFPGPQLDTKDEFVRNTLEVRVPQIIARTLEYNPRLGKECVDKIKALAEDMKKDLPLRLLKDSAPDTEDWNNFLKPIVDKGLRWSNAPWFAWECYVYRRLFEATNFWETKSDYFAREKMTGLANTRREILQRVKVGAKIGGTWSWQGFRRILALDLWGNQADGSLFDVETIKMKGGKGNSNKLLSDMSEKMWEILNRPARMQKGRNLRKVVFFNDNAGLEIASDLVLAYYLLKSGRVTHVELKLKPYPFFVSDANPGDVLSTIKWLSDMEEKPYAVKMAKELKTYIESKQLLITTEFFLTSGRPMWEMPQVMREELSMVDLVIVKGDLMYRKLVGDYKFPWNTSFEALLGYFPCPVASLRTCKSPVVVGIQRKLGLKLSKQDKGWLTTGKYAVIQVADPQAIRAVVVGDQGFDVVLNVTTNACDNMCSIQ